MPDPLLAAETAGPPTVLVTGEALIDVIASQDGAARKLPGGSTLNVAVGLGRLGDDVVLLTKLGDDAEALLIDDHLARSRVRLQSATARG